MQPRLPFDAKQGEHAPPTMYFVRHQRARRYLVRVEPTGSVRVTIPRGGSQRVAEAFAARQRVWISRQLVRLKSQQSRFSSDERAAFQARAMTELPVQLYSLAARLGLQVSRVSIRNQRSRWGSCGRDGHIMLNWRLVAMPDWVREYVLIHELMHLRRLDHSPKYWALVARACPHYADARAWLRAHGPALL